MRMWCAGLALCACFVAGVSAPAEAQTIGIGPRLSFVKSDNPLVEDSVRFGGFGARLGGGRLAFELSVDFHSRTDDLLAAEIKDRPVQASALYFPVRGGFSPYLMGGLGWFTQIVKPLPASDLLEEASTTRMGYHAGLGLELKLGRNLGVYGDYRYTFLDVNGDDEDLNASTPRLIPFAGRLGLSNEGSAWSWGFNVYF
jgi:hypothetical protein